MIKNNDNLEYLENPEIFQINRDEAHSDHWFYEKMSDINLKEYMPLKQSLNGTWRFSYSKNLSNRVKDFYKDDFDISGFDYINVPGHIQLQGYDKPQYINTIYPWEGHDFLRPPYISKSYNPVGSYVRFFELEENLKDKKVFISFQGVETAFCLWINGNFVGYSEDTFTPAEFEISSFLKEERNKVAVEVYKRSSASWLEDQDFWRFSGIFRDVYLYAIPETHINDIFVKTDLYDNYKNANLKADIKLVGNNKCKISAYVKDNDGNKIASVEDIDFQENITINMDVKDIKLWSSEEPNLYTLYILVLKNSGELIEVVPQKVGFREFKMIDNIMTLNGKRVLFKGVNRHEFNARNGRAISKDDMIFDISILKQNNINSVRTSHYPNQSLWYSLCDEYGIYVIDETNLESHGSWQKLGKCEPSWNIPGNLKEWKGAVLDRAESMLERDKNHPSILIWSCGNESYAGEDIYEISEYFRRRDKSRLVHYEGVFWNRKYENTSDMESRMYAKAKEIEEYLKDNPKKPYISCEYMHSMGNSTGGMMKYTELEDKYKMYQGGFIWDYMDQALYRKTPQGREVLSYGGDFEDRPSDYNFSGNGLVYADRKVSPKMQEVKFLYSNVKLYPDKNGVKIKNDNLFINIDKYDLVYSVKKEEMILDEGITKVSLEAGSEKYFNLPFSNYNYNSELVYTVSLRLREKTLWADKGYEISYGQYIHNQHLKDSSSVDDKSKLKIIDGDGYIGVKGELFSAIFSKQEGGIVSLKYGAKEMITRLPKPIYYRATTDNDKGNGYDFRCAMWLGATNGQKYYDFEVNEEENKLNLKFKYNLPTHPGTDVEIDYEVEGCGRIKVKVHYIGIEGLPELPMLGLTFKLNNEFKYFKWYGKGPDENYIDRCEGAKLDVYESNSYKNLSKYLVPQECGNRTGTRWIKVQNADNEGLKFTYVDKPFEFSVLPYSMMQLEDALHLEDLNESNFTYVNIIGKQMGVGGDDSWGAPILEEFKIDSSKDLEYEFYISNALV